MSPQSRRLASLALGTLLLLAASAQAPAFAGEKRVLLEVEGMWCPSCQYIVEQVLEQVPGVIDARVSAAEGRALVIFDDAKTSVDRLVAATKEYGYDSRPLGGEG